MGSGGEGNSRVYVVGIKGRQQSVKGIREPHVAVNIASQTKTKWI